VCADFVENLHPRDELGRWTFKGTGGWQVDAADRSKIAEFKTNDAANRRPATPNVLSDLERGMLQEYRSVGHDLNKNLRAGRPISDKETWQGSGHTISGMVETMDVVIARTQIWDKTTLHRLVGDDFYNELRTSLKPGDVIRSKAYTETSLMVPDNIVNAKNKMMILAHEDANAVALPGTPVVVLPRNAPLTYVGEDAGTLVFEYKKTAEQKQQDADAATESAMHPEVVNVGGDVWNRETAQRLEREYVMAKPALEQLANSAVDQQAEIVVEEPEEDDGPVAPEEWSMLSDDKQTEIQEIYEKQTYNDFLDSEVSNWYEQGEALHIAKKTLADNFPDDDWANDALEKAREDSEDEIPYTDAQLLDAITLTYDDEDYEGKADPEIEFDDSKLREPKGYIEQPTLPGIEPENPALRLTKEMREAISDALVEKFNNKADHDQGSVEAPDYLSENVSEMQDEYWGSMDNKDKFNWAKKNTSIIDELSDEYQAYHKDKTAKVVNELGKLDKLPEHYDPLNLLDNTDYKRTQVLAAYLSRERAAQVMLERKIKYPHPGAQPFDKGVALAAANEFEGNLWRSWKSSSSSDDGKLLQLAAADELGGRLREGTNATEINRARIIEIANKKYDSAGGYEGVKAYIRAKWEVTQYLLDKADVHTLNVFRAIRLPDTRMWEAKQEPNGKFIATNHAGLSPQTFDTMQEAQKFVTEAAAPDTSIGKTVEVGQHTLLPDFVHKRNGAMSTSLKSSVSNNWGSSSTRVVLRFTAPRTAAVSIPVFGRNDMHEREVILAGVAYHAWDAWLRTAPEFEDVSMIREPLKQAA
jgi:hypothetical protein